MMDKEIKIEKAEEKLFDAFSMLLYTVPLLILFSIVISFANDGDVGNIASSVSSMVVGIIWLIIIIKVLTTINQQLDKTRAHEIAMFELKKGNLKKGVRGDDLDDMTKSELLDLARKNGIDHLSAKDKKSEIIEEISNYLN